MPTELFELCPRSVNWVIRIFYYSKALLSVSASRLRFSISEYVSQ